jgi:GntR family transcriptional regulator/MocR family aminotransferase
MLQMGVPALDAFPRKVWARLATRQVRAASNLVRPPVQGFQPLRDAIAAYLLRSRGIVCDASQVIVVSGYAAALGLTVQALSLERRSVWVESPGYLATPPLLRNLGMMPVAVPVDPQGLDVQAGQACCPDAGLAVVTPSHQSPLGVALSLPRRLALLQWASEADAWILEDDYDSEFRYTGPPLPALKSLDRKDRVVYCGTFSKVLFPGLRLSYMVVPRRRLDDFSGACRFGLWGVCPELLQAVVCDFMRGGDFARHIKRMRALYAKRRAFLVDALRARAPAGMTVHMTQGGMHLLVSVPAGVSDVDWARRARMAGFAVQPLSLWSLEPGGGQGLMMGFTNVESAAQAQEQVDALMKAVGR